MIEQFRVWKHKGRIKIKYTDSTGSINFFEADQGELLGQIQAIVSRYMDAGIKLTSRQLYYQLVAGAIIPNADKVYKRICSFLTDARYGGCIDWDAIEDRGRVPEKHAEWDNVQDLVKSAVYSYRLPRWSDQDNYVELYCEKQAMESVLKPIADKWHIYFGYNKGYSSASTVYDLAKWVKERIEAGKEVKILYLGDHDASGLDMVRDIRERVEEFLTQGGEHTEPNFEVIHIALTTNQVRQYNPPPNPAKLTDPRAKWYMSQFGGTSWELDSLKPEVLIQLTEDGIKQWLDLKKYNSWVKREKNEIQALEKFAEELAREEDYKR